MTNSWTPSPPLSAERTHGPWRIAAIYALVAGLWIFFSDQLLAALVDEASLKELTWFQTLKGWFFILATSVMLYFLVRRSLGSLHASQQALGQSENRFRRILETAEEGVWIGDPDFRTGFVNARMAGMLGYTTEEMMGLSILDLVHPEDQGLAHAQTERRKQGQKDQFDLRFRHKAGHWIWVLITANPLYDEAGQFTGSLSMVSDITLRKQMEEALRESEERFRLLVEGARDYCLYMLDAAGNVTTWNAGAQRLTGHSAEQVVGQSFVRLFAPEPPGQATEECLDRARMTGVCEGEGQGLRADCSRYWMHRIVTAVRCPDGKLRGFAVLTRDTTESRRAQEALRESQARFRAIFQDAGMGILVCDRAGRILDANPALHEMLGYAPDQLREKSFGDITHPDDLADSIRHHRSLRDGLAVERQAVKRYLRKDGTPVWARRTATAVRDAAGQIQYVIAIIEDISERRRIREQIQELNATLEQRVAERTRELEEAKGELEAFAYTVSHELRAPLHSIQGFAQRLLESHEQVLDDSGQEEARRIIGGAARMRGLIEDLLDYGRSLRFDLQPQKISLSLLVHETVGRLERDFPDRASIITVDHGLPSVLGHRMALSHVIYNLMSNAIEHVAADVRPVVHVWAESASGLTRLWIEDNGPGLPQEQLDRLTRASAASPAATSAVTGLGLDIIRRGIERMGGRFGVEPAPGAGSRFWLELPAAT